jgi:hypothetical protein
VYVQDGANDKLSYTISRRVPLDEDTNPSTGAVVGDGLADKWERAMAARYRNQYGPGAALPGSDLQYFSMDSDKERHRPGPRPAYTFQHTSGDAHTALEEYRGYILDGGGFNGLGANGHAGGHIRLDPARKELLVEVDKGTVLTGLPNGDVPAAMNEAAKVFSSTGVAGAVNRGAGIYMYYVIDQTQAIPLADVDTIPEIAAKMLATRNSTLQSDFLHLLLFDEGTMAASKAAGVPPVPAFSFGDLWPVPRERGAVIGTKDLHTEFADPPFSDRLGVYATTIAHELVHLLIRPNGAEGFDGEEHTEDANEDGIANDAQDRSCLMYHKQAVENARVSTARLFPLVQAYIDLSNSEGLVQ